MYRRGVAVHSYRLRRLIQRLDKRGAAQQFPEQLAVFGNPALLGKALLERTLELAEKDATANGGAEAAGEAAEHAGHGRGNDM